MNIYKQIYKKIKKADTIIIARHVGPDPDALGSSLGLKQIIIDNFPKKKVYVIGNPTAKFRFLGEIDKLEENYKDALLIVTDTPDAHRVDGLDPRKIKNSIKIDHHPFIEKTCALEWIDCTSSSACQMILELVFNTKLKLTKEAAEKLYAGIIADTNRFMFAYTTSKTFYLVSKMLEVTNIDINKIYNNLYLRPYKEVKFQGYIAEHLTITNQKVAYIIINSDTIREYNVDPATAGNMINNFNFINEILIWVTFAEDKDQNSYRVSIRSRGPIINEVAAKYGGGGHIYASGTRLKDEWQINNLINDLNKVAEKYLK